jgi:flagellar biosynthesis protein FlhG
MDENTAPCSPLHCQRRFAPRVLAITSGLGGVGKSCVAVNLGAALAELGQKVLILDADLGQAGIARLLGLRPRYTIMDVLAGHKSLAQVIMTGPGGLQVVPGNPGSAGFVELSQAHKLLLLEELDACTAQLDFVLVDTGAGLSDNVLYFNLGAQERLVVADQEPASVINAYTLIKVLAGRYAQKRFQLLFNKITRPREARRSFEQLTKVADRFLRGAVALEYLGVIPEDDSVPQSVSEQSVLVKIKPHSPAALAFAETARALLSRETNHALDGNIKFFWQSLNRQAADTFSQGDCHASQ